jgi:hypothetical protein
MPPVRAAIEVAGAEFACPNASREQKIAAELTSAARRRSRAGVGIDMTLSQTLGEGYVRARTIWSVALAATVAGCAAAKPHTFGAYNDLSPRVAAQQGERTPQHVTVELNRPANVAVFYVVPGRGSELLFPADSTQSGFLQSGSHTVATARARMALSDTSRLTRRPDQTPVPGQRPQTRNGFDPSGRLGMNQRGYLLVYASQDSLPFSTLSTKVSGVSIPIDDADALNTVTKLIRATTHTTGQWAAYASEFPL